MAITTSPTICQKSPERAFALQKYLLLHSQHDALLKSISSSRNSSISSSPESSSRRQSSASSASGFSSSSSTTPPFSNPFSSSISPISEDEAHFPSTHSHAHTQSRHHHRDSRRNSLPSAHDDEDSLTDEESKLADVNLQIKLALTELLNCESVRNDQAYRMWVQSRLMDAEQELKTTRRESLDNDRARRRSSVEFSGLI